MPHDFLTCSSCSEPIGDTAIRFDKWIIDHPDPQDYPDPAFDVWILWEGEPWCFDCLVLCWLGMAEGETEVKVCSVCGMAYGPRAWSRLLPPDGGGDTILDGTAIQLRQCWCHNILEVGTSRPTITEERMTTTDGEIRACTFAEYCQLDGVNASSLKALRISPAHYLEAIATQKKPTAAMILGTAVHTAVFEPNRFLLDYVLWSGGRRFGTKWDEFAGAHGDKVILRKEDYHKALAIGEAVRANPIAARYLRNGLPERAILWTDPETGLGMKGRIDWLAGGPNHPIIVGLKTASDAGPRWFPRSAANFGYHLQWAMYFDGLRQITGREAEVIEVVVESSPPWDCVVYRIGEDTLAEGRGEYHRLARRLRECVEADDYPGQALEMIDFEFPAWAITQPENAPAIDVSGLGEVA